MTSVRPARTLHRESFRAMGTDCTVAASAAAHDVALARRALAAARAEVDACERSLSRFDDASDLSRLNSRAGSWVGVDERLVSALVAALDARTTTGGRFDPTILPALVAAGYDRSFELLTPRPAAPIASWRAGATVEVDAAASRARIPRGAAVDLGGIGKGFAATRALLAMRTSWPTLTGALVDLGGDIAFWGAPPEGGLWRIDIADPRKPGRMIGTLELEGGGIATSGRDARRFGTDGELHHLIDPATGRPAAAGPLSVTVLAPTATRAEAHATALAVMDLGEATRHLAAQPDIAALLVPDVGEPIVIGLLPLTLISRRVELVMTTEGRFTCV